MFLRFSLILLGALSSLFSLPGFCLAAATVGVPNQTTFTSAAGVVLQGAPTLFRTGFVDGVLLSSTNPSTGGGFTLTYYDSATGALTNPIGQVTLTATAVSAWVSNWVPLSYVNGLTVTITGPANGAAGSVSPTVTTVTSNR